MTKACLRTAQLALVGQSDQTFARCIVRNDLLEQFVGIVTEMMIEIEAHRAGSSTITRSVMLLTHENIAFTDTTLYQLSININYTRNHLNI
jgi:hypothetical protein